VESVGRITQLEKTDGKGGNPMFELQPGELTILLTLITVVVFYVAFGHKQPY
jgi:hypothetical protein